MKHWHWDGMGYLIFRHSYMYDVFNDIWLLYLHLHAVSNVALYTARAHPQSFKKLHSKPNYLEWSQEILDQGWAWGDHRWEMLGAFLHCWGSFHLGGEPRLLTAELGLTALWRPKAATKIQDPWGTVNCKHRKTCGRPVETYGFWRKWWVFCNVYRRVRYPFSVCHFLSSTSMIQLASDTSRAAVREGIWLGTLTPCNMSWCSWGMLTLVVSRRLNYFCMWVFLLNSIWHDVWWYLMIDIKSFRTSNSTVKAGAIADGYGWIPINTIFSGMNIHLPAILGFTRYQGFDPSPDCQTDDKFGESLPEHSQIPLFLAEKNLSVESPGTAEGKRPRSRLVEGLRQSTA